MKRKVQLQQRDLDLLEHIRRYTMTTPDAVRRMPFFDGASMDTVKNVLKRLRQGDYIVSGEEYQLYGKRRYYQLTRRGANAIGAHESVTEPLKDITRIRAFAALSFCCMHEPRQVKLTPDEFRERFPQLQQRGGRLDYYIDTFHGSTRLGFMRVDFGGRSRWDRIIGTLRQEVQKRCSNPHFRSFVISGGFALTVVTAFERKAERLTAALQEADLPEEVRFRVVAVPELLYLLAPPPEGQSDA